MDLEKVEQVGRFLSITVTRSPLSRICCYVLSHSVEWMALHTIALTLSAYVLVMVVLKSKMTAVRVFTPDLQTINRDFVLYK